MDEVTQQLEQHYNEIGPSLLLYFRRRCVVEGADDLLQETFLRAWNHRDRLAAAVSPRAYLFGIARHVWVDARRRFHPTVPLGADDELAVDDAPLPDERLAQMRAAIAALPAIHREALRLKLEHELSYAEIADVLDVPIGTVRSRLHHAVRQLQDELNHRGSSGPTNGGLTL